MKLIDRVLKYRERNRLSWQLVLAVVLCSVFVTLLAASVQLYVGYQRDVKAIHQNIEHVKESHLQAITSSVYNFDDDLLRIQFEGALRLHDIIYIEVTENTKQENVYMAAGEPGHVNTLATTFPLNHKDLLGNTIPVGSLTVVASLDGVRQRLWGNAGLILISTTIQTFLLAFVILVVIQIIITRPLIGMARYTEKLDIEHLNVPLDLQRQKIFSKKPDEIDQVVNSMNDLRLRLQQDITERKQAEESLRESEERWFSLTSNSDDIFQVLDVEGKILYMSKVYPPHKLADVIGKYVFEFMDDRSKKIAKESIKSLLKEKTPQDFETNIFIPGRDSIPFEVKYVPMIMDDKVDSIIAHSSNISERKRAEEELRKSEAQLSNAMEIAKLGYWEYDVDSNLFTFNDHFYSVFRTSAEEVGGYTMTPDRYAQVFVHPEDKSIVAEEMRKALETTDPNYSRQLEHRIVYADGETGYIAVRFFIVKGDQGLTIKTYGANQDITARKRAEEEKMKLESQLRQAMKMEAIGTLAGGIAHDFNNILGAIMGYTELGKLDAPEGSRLEENLGEVLRATGRAKDLVQQILTFSRQTEQKLKPVQASLVVDEALKLLRASLPTTIEIHQDVKSDGLVMADPTQIHQVVMNLCTNAGHAMEEKGGVLEVSLVNVELDSDFVTRHPDIQSGPYLQLTVNDTGHGMPPEILDRAFDPFYSTKETGEGTGLGLSVVHGIVKSHGGTLYAYSEPERGSTFKVYLPAIERRLEPERREKKALPKGTEHILYVDDEEALVAIGKQMLESLGYEVTTRMSSPEALKLFEAHPERFDLVITDQTMPGMTGDQLAKELIAVRSNIPIILCTGFSRRITEEKAYEMGIGGFIMKPLIMQDLAETVRKLLDEN